MLLEAVVHQIEQVEFLRKDLDVAISQAFAFMPKADVKKAGQLLLHALAAVHGDPQKVDMARGKILTGIAYVARNADAAGIMEIHQKLLKMLDEDPAAIGASETFAAGLRSVLETTVTRMEPKKLKEFPNEIFRLFRKHHQAILSSEELGHIYLTVFRALAVRVRQPELRAFAEEFLRFIGDEFGNMKEFSSTMTTYWKTIDALAGRADEEPFVGTLLLRFFEKWTAAFEESVRINEENPAVPSEIKNLRSALERVAAKIPPKELEIFKEEIFRLLRTHKRAIQKHPAFATTFGSVLAVIAKRMTREEYSFHIGKIKITRSVLLKMVFEIQNAMDGILKALLNPRNVRFHWFNGFQERSSALRTQIFDLEQEFLDEGKPVLPGIILFAPAFEVFAGRDAAGSLTPFLPRLEAWVLAISVVPKEKGFNFGDNELSSITKILEIMARRIDSKDLETFLSCLLRLFETKWKQKKEEVSAKKDILNIMRIAHFKFEAERLNSWMDFYIRLLKEGVGRHILKNAAAEGLADALMRIEGKLEGEIDEHKDLRDLLEQATYAALRHYFALSPSENEFGPALFTRNLEGNLAKIREILRRPDTTRFKAIQREEDALQAQDIRENAEAAATNRLDEKSKKPPAHGDDLWLKTGPQDEVYGPGSRSELRNAKSALSISERVLSLVIAQPGDSAWVISLKRLAVRVLAALGILYNEPLRQLQIDLENIALLGVPEIKDYNMVSTETERRVPLSVSRLIIGVSRTNRTYPARRIVNILLSTLHKLSTVDRAREIRRMTLKIILESIFDAARKTAAWQEVRDLSRRFFSIRGRSEAAWRKRWDLAGQITLRASDLTFRLPDLLEILAKMWDLIQGDSHFEIMTRLEIVRSMSAMGARIGSIHAAREELKLDQWLHFLDTAGPEVGFLIRTKYLIAVGALAERIPVGVLPLTAGRLLEVFTETYHGPDLFGEELRPKLFHVFEQAAVRLEEKLLPHFVSRLISDYEGATLQTPTAIHFRLALVLGLAAAPARTDVAQIPAIRRILEAEFKKALEEVKRLTDIRITGYRKGKTKIHDQAAVRIKIYKSDVLIPILDGMTAVTERIAAEELPDLESSLFGELGKRLESSDNLDTLGQLLTICFLRQSGKWPVDKEDPVYKALLFYFTERSRDPRGDSVLLYPEYRKLDELRYILQHYDLRNPAPIANAIHQQIQNMRTEFERRAGEKRSGDEKIEPDAAPHGDDLWFKTGAPYEVPGLDSRSELRNTKSALTASERLLDLLIASPDDSALALKLKRVVVRILTALGIFYSLPLVEFQSELELIVLRKFPDTDNLGEMDQYVAEHLAGPIKKLVDSRQGSRAVSVMNVILGRARSSGQAGSGMHLLIFPHAAQYLQDQWHAKLNFDNAMELFREFLSIKGNSRRSLEKREGVAHLFAMKMYAAPRLIEVLYEMFDAVEGNSNTECWTRNILVTAFLKAVDTKLKTETAPRHVETLEKMFSRLPNPPSGSTELENKLSEFLTVRPDESPRAKKLKSLLGRFAALGGAGSPMIGSITKFSSMLHMKLYLQTSPDYLPLLTGSLLRMLKELPDSSWEDIKSRQYLGAILERVAGNLDPALASHFAVILLSELQQVQDLGSVGHEIRSVLVNGVTEILPKINISELAMIMTILIKEYFRIQGDSGVSLYARGDTARALGELAKYVPVPELLKLQETIFAALLAVIKKSDEAQALKNHLIDVLSVITKRIDIAHLTLIKPWLDAQMAVAMFEKLPALADLLAAYMMRESGNWPEITGKSEAFKQLATYLQMAGKKKSVESESLEMIRELLQRYEAQDPRLVTALHQEIENWTALRSREDNARSGKNQAEAPEAKKSIGDELWLSKSDQARSELRGERDPRKAENLSRRARRQFERIMRRAQDPDIPHLGPLTEYQTFRTTVKRLPLSMAPEYWDLLTRGFAILASDEKQPLTLLETMQNAWAWRLNRTKPSRGIRRISRRQNHFS